MNQKAKIDYPTMWTYKVIGREEKAIREAILEVLGDTAKPVPSKQSSKGRFISLEVSILVHSDEERTGLYHRLQKHPDVKIVL